MLKSGNRSWLLLNLVLILSHLPLSFAGEILDTIVATVNGKPVLLSELYRARNESKEFFGEEVTDLTIIREQLIEDILLEAYADERGIRVTQEEIDSEIEKIASKNTMTKEGFLKRIEEEGIHRETYRRLIQQRLLRSRLIQREVLPWITVDEADLEAYRRSHPDRFRTKPQVELFHAILTPEEVLRNLPQCHKITICLERTFSPEESKGILPRLNKTIFSLDELPREIQSWLGLPLSPGVMRLFADPSGRIKIVVFSQRIPSQDLPLSQIRDKLSDLVRQEKLEQSYLRWLGELKKNAVIERFPLPEL